MVTDVNLESCNLETAAVIAYLMSSFVNLRISLKEIVKTFISDAWETGGLPKE
jgi:hypothetical protein